MEIKHTQVVVKKENRRDEDSKQVTSNYTAATEVLKSGFGIAKHFVQRSKEQGARIVRRLMLVAPIMPRFKNSSAVT